MNTMTKDEIKKDTLPDSGIETNPGTHSITPAMVASWQVLEAIKVILKKGDY